MSWPTIHQSHHIPSSVLYHHTNYSHVKRLFTVTKLASRDEWLKYNTRGHERDHQGSWADGLNLGIDPCPKFGSHPLHYLGAMRAAITENSPCSS